MQIKAAVVSERSGPFAIETVELCEPRPDEVIVRVVGSGMCQTDLHGRDGYFDSPYPAVYGHEGAGVVHAVGNAVSGLKPGDHVVMSYPWCGACANCVRYALETSAVPAVFREAIEVLMPAGTCVLLGSARKGSEASFEMPFLQQGRSVRGVVQGDSVPQEFIPKLVDLIMAEKFPIERMIKFYDFADINLAAQESSAGIAIKPVLRMPQD